MANYPAVSTVRTRDALRPVYGETVALAPDLEERVVTSALWLKLSGLRKAHILIW